MKKIFLTSGVIVCMVCPAFATGESWSGATSGTQSTGCTEPNLGVYSGPTQMDAVWIPNKGRAGWNDAAAIKHQQTQCGANNTLVTHSGEDANWNTVYTAGSPYPYLYTLYDVGVYPSEAARSADTNYTGAGAITRLTRVPSYVGYTFGGYYSDSSFTAASQMVDASGNISSNLKTMITQDNGDLQLYGKWTANTYTGAIKYACGTAGSNAISAKSGVSMNQNVTFDDCYSLAAVTDKCTVPANIGYTFAGWDCKTGSPATQANLPGATVQSNGYYAAGAGGVWNDAALGTASVTCTAKWNAKEIKPITWNTAGGTAGSTAGSTSCFYDGSVTLPSQPTRTGFTFSGWKIGTLP